MYEDIMIWINIISPLYHENSSFNMFLCELSLFTKMLILREVTI